MDMTPEKAQTAQFAPKSGTNSVQLLRVIFGMRKVLPEAVVYPDQAKGKEHRANTDGRIDEARRGQGQPDHYRRTGDPMTLWPF